MGPSLHHRREAGEGEGECARAGDPRGLWPGAGGTRRPEGDVGAPKPTDSVPSRQRPVRTTSARAARPPASGSTDDDGGGDDDGRKRKR